jgi:hypothetical protein
MTKLEMISIDYFKEILAIGREVLGHPDFVFKIDVTIGSKPKDSELAKIIGERIQDALDTAKSVARPEITIEGTTLQ